MKNSFKEEYKLHTRKTLSYFSKINETKMFIIGLILGVFLSAFVQILLLPLNYNIEAVQNDTLINLMYGNNPLLHVTLNGFVIIWVGLFLIVIILSWRYAIRTVYKIPSGGDEESFKNTEKPSVQVEKLKKRLESSVGLSGLSYTVKSIPKEGKFLVFLYDGDADEVSESDFGDSDFKIEIAKDYVIFKWQPKEKIISLIDLWNEKT